MTIEASAHREDLAIVLNTPPKADWPALDIVRFCAALMVACYHLTYWWWLPTVGAASETIFSDSMTPFTVVTRWGWVGVHIFFVLSGFVIAQSMHGRSVRPFLRSRILRLYPAVWICAPITYVVCKWGMPGALNELWRALVLFPVGPWISGVYWTLAIEMVFYALMALALGLGLSVRSAGLTLTFIGSMYWIVRTFDFFTGKHLASFFILIEQSAYGSLSLLPTACLFGLGMILQLHVTGKATWLSWSLVATSIVSGAMAVTLAARLAIASEGGAAVSMFVPGTIWLAAVVVIYASTRWQGALPNWFHTNRRLLRMLGLMTYPLYLVHSELGRFLTKAFATGISPGFAILAALIVVMALSAVIVRMEAYPRRWLAKIIGPRGDNVLSDGGADLVKPF